MRKLWLAAASCVVVVVVAFSVVVAVAVFLVCREYDVKMKTRFLS